jgi:hypothetical protein
MANFPQLRLVTQRGIANLRFPYLNLRNLTTRHGLKSPGEMLLAPRDLIVTTNSLLFC